MSVGTVCCRTGAGAGDIAMLEQGVKGDRKPEKKRRL